jgi:hypothetical protein
MPAAITIRRNSTHAFASFNISAMIPPINAHKHKKKEAFF